MDDCVETRRRPVEQLSNPLRMRLDMYLDFD